MPLLYTLLITTVEVTPVVDVASRTDLINAEDVLLFALNSSAVIPAMPVAQPNEIDVCSTVIVTAGANVCDGLLVG